MAEIRKDIITGGAVIISPERGKRPHDFKQSESNIPSTQNYHEDCPFCQGNEGQTPPEIFAYREGNYGPNEKGWSIRAVPNLFSPLKKDTKLEVLERGFYEKISAAGTAEVFIETPEHKETLGTHSHEQVVKIIKGLKERYISLKEDERLKYIQVFKNFGSSGGASKEHAHWQIMSLPIVPELIEKEIIGSKKYYEDKKICPYCDIVKKELSDNERVVIESESFIAVCPYASKFAFETWIIPKVHKGQFELLTENEIDDLAKVLKDIVSKMERGFNYPPYNIVIHTTPIDMGEQTYYHWHIEILPRLTIFAGFEWGTGVIINPTPPELATQSLKEI